MVIFKESSIIAFKKFSLPQYGSELKLYSVQQSDQVAVQCSLNKGKQKKDRENSHREIWKRKFNCSFYLFAPFRVKFDRIPKEQSTKTAIKGKVLS